MRSGLISLALMTLACGPAFAQDCGPLKQISSIDMTPLPGTAVMTVPASFNGTTAPLLVDTAAGISNMRDASLAQLGLHGIDNSRIEMLDSAGNASKRFVQVDDFAVGAIRSKNLQFMVSPSGSTDLPYVGALAADLMELYDVEMDFSGRKLNFFAKDHCPGHVLYWNPAAIAIVPITLRIATGDSSRTGFRSYVQRAAHLYVPVTLDGKNFQAMLDTGSQRSTMTARTARFIFGVDAQSPGSAPKGTLDGDPGHPVFSHSFATLTFDTVTVTNPHFTVIPDLVGAKDPNNSSRTDSRVKKIDDNIGGDVTIGMDVLRKLRLYIAFREGKLYISPATAPVPVQADAAFAHQSASAH
jgi:predicted aspartyl protease